MTFTQSAMAHDMSASRQILCDSLDKDSGNLLHAAVKAQKLGVNMNCLYNVVRTLESCSSSSPVST
jgi:GTP-sensing pleiotropic transcriptional regulator CodY